MGGGGVAVQRVAADSTAQRLLRPCRPRLRILFLISLLLTLSSAPLTSLPICLVPCYQADVRWGNSDPTVVSLEILTVVIGGPLSLYIAYLTAKNDMSRHPWLLMLCAGELYGG